MIAKDPEKSGDIYKKFLGDKLPADLGYLYENIAAQILASRGTELYYHTWHKENSTHSFEIDFLLSRGSKIIPIEVKSSETKNHESIDRFAEKYRQYIDKRYLFSQKDVSNDKDLQLKPVYMLPFLFYWLLQWHWSNNLCHGTRDYWSFPCKDSGGNSYE